MGVRDLLVIGGLCLTCLTWCGAASPEIISGNCQSYKLPPLAAFGSLTVNPHPALHPEFRLNGHQRPVTHRFQNFQHREGCLFKSGPVVKMANLKLSLGAQECCELSISTDVVNSETCIVTYGTEGGLIKDYYVTGNPFHDLYFENLTPVMTCLDHGDPLGIKVDQGPFLPWGSVVKGRSFEVVFKEASILVFVETPEDKEVLFQVGQEALLTAQEPLTGFIRLALISHPSAPKPSGVKTVFPTAMSDYLLDHFTAESSNPFLQQFHRIQADFFSLDASHFQNGYRKLTDYRLSDPIDVRAVYAAHRRSIPVRADVAYTSHSLTFSYTLFSGGDPLIVFPAWKQLQGLKEGVVPTIPGGGEPLQNFSYFDCDLGVVLGGEAKNGKVTFLEGALPAWYGPDLFIPRTLAFTPSQIAALNSALKETSSWMPELTFEDPKAVLRKARMLAQTGISAAYFLTVTGQAGSIMTMTKPFIDHAKSLLTTLLINRTPGTVFFVADRTVGGICAGEFDYNHHVALVGDALVAAAMITEWELVYTQGPLWVQLPVRGADHREYTISDFVDFLWRDVHSPFQDDPDLPYDRCGDPWRGQSRAAGLQVRENPLFENPGDDFNCWYGMNAYARCMLKTSLNSEQMARYEAVRDFSEINLKMVSSAVKGR